MKITKSKEGKLFSDKVKDDVVEIFSKIGAFIPRLIQHEDELYLDIRIFYTNQDDRLAPTGKGIRMNLRNVRGLYKTMRSVKKFLEEQALWDDIGDAE